MGKRWNSTATESLCAGSRGRAFTMCGCSVPGRHNASNALAAIAAVRALGVRIEDAVACDGPLRRAEARLETVGTPDGVTVIDDFAHNPDKIDATPGDPSRPARAAADHVPAARLRPADQDGRGARATALARRNGARTTGSTFRTRSTRAGRSRRRAAATGSPSSREAWQAADIRRPRRASAMRLWRKPSPATGS